MKNVTLEPMSLDLLREEVQILISTMIFIEFKLILNHSYYYYSKKMDTTLLVDVIIKFLVVSSKRKIIYRLGLDRYTTLENSNEWIIKKYRLKNTLL